MREVNFEKFKIFGGSFTGNCCFMLFAGYAKIKTRQTETSKYLLEKKSTERPLLVASERGLGNNLLKHKK